MQPWELAAREGIRDTIAAYTDAGDRFRLDDLAAQFAENGVLEVKGRSVATGRAEIVAMLGESSSRSRPTTEPFFIRHFVANLRFVSLTPDRADTTAYFLVMTPSGPDHWGRYRDTLVREADRWRFAHRLAAVDGYTPNSWYAAGA